MKDQKYFDLLISIQVNISSGKTPNIRRSKTTSNHLIIHLNHLIHHLNHLIHHLNHLNHRFYRNLHWIKLQDLLQRWQNDTKFCKHYRKLEANPSVEDDNEVFYLIRCPNHQVSSGSSISVSILSSEPMSWPPGSSISSTYTKFAPNRQLPFFYQITVKNSICFSYF